MPSLENNISGNLITISVLSLNLSFAKHAGQNTWSYNVPEQRGKVHAQGATRNLSICMGLSLTPLTESPEAAVDHIVIGGGMSRCSHQPPMLNPSRRDRGVVGLAVARALLRRFPDRSTVLVERHNLPGEETR